MSRKHLAVLACIPLIALAACGGSSSGGSQNDGAIVVGGMFGLTGATAFAGVPGKNAFEMAADIVNADPAKYLGNAERQLEFEIQDSGADVPKAATVFRGLASNQDVVAVVGPTTSNQAFTVGPYAEQLEVPLVVPSAFGDNITDPGDHVFQIALSGDKVIKPLLDYAEQRFGFERVCVIYTSDNEGNVNVASAVEEALLSAGTDVTMASVLYVDTDFGSAITKCNTANAQATFFVLPGPAITSFMAQADQAGYQSQYLGLTTLGGAVPTAKDLAIGAIYASDYNVDLDTALNQEFVEKYTAKYDVAPDVWAGQAFSAAMVVVNAISLVDGDVTREALTEALAEVTDAEVVVGEGTFAFGEEREADFVVPLLEVQADGTSVAAQ